MSNSDRSRSPASHRLGATSARAELPGFPRWCGPMSSAVRNLNSMPRAHIISGTLWVVWVVSTSDGFSTHGSLQLDQCSSFSTISSAFSTEHSCHTILHLPSDTTLPIHTQRAHQSIPIQLTVPFRTSSTIQHSTSIFDGCSSLWL